MSDDWLDELRKIRDEDQARVQDAAADGMGMPSYGNS